MMLVYVFMVLALLCDFLPFSTLDLTRLLTQPKLKTENTKQNIGDSICKTLQPCPKLKRDPNQILYT